MIGTTKVLLSLTKVSQVPLILPDNHVVKLGGVAGLDLDLLSCFSACVDLMALECAEDRIEAALFDFVPTSQTFNHLPMSMRSLRCR